jgi:hypothetical protein
MSEYKDPRGLVPWNADIPKQIPAKNIPTINPEFREWTIRSKHKPKQPCPFCGVEGKGLLLAAYEEREDEEYNVKQPWNGVVFYRVCCLLCGCEGPSGLSEAIAVSKWDGNGGLI